MVVPVGISIVALVILAMMFGIAAVDAVLAEGLNHHLFLTRVLSGSGKKAVPR